MVAFDFMHNMAGFVMDGHVQYYSSIIESLQVGWDSLWLLLFYFSLAQVWPLSEDGFY